MGKDYCRVRVEVRVEVRVDVGVVIFRDRKSLNSWVRVSVQIRAPVGIRVGARFRVRVRFMARVMDSFRVGIRATISVWLVKKIGEGLNFLRQGGRIKAIKMYFRR